MLKVVNLANIAFLNHFLPFSRKEFSEIMMYGGIANRIFDCTTLGGKPIFWNGPRRIYIQIQVKRHGDP